MRYVTFAATVALSATFSPGAANATNFSVGAQAYSYTRFNPQPRLQDSYHSPTPRAPITLTSTAVGLAGRASATGTASSTVGAVHAFATARADSYVCCATAGTDSVAEAIYEDSFFLSSRTISPGTIGRLTVAFLVHGNTINDSSGVQPPERGGRTQWSGSLQWQAWAYVNGTGIIDSYNLYSDYLGRFDESGHNSFGLQYVNVDVIFGRNNTTYLHVADQVQVTADGTNAFADFTADLGNTVSWQGITSLIVGGVAVTDYSAISPDTGFNFRQGLAPAPEPASWALMLLGFGLVGTTMRRRGALFART